MCVASPKAELDAPGKVTLGKPVVQGKLSVDEVERALESVTPSWLGCYQRATAQKPGTVRARFVIGRDGAVANVSNAGSTLRDTAVVGCCMNALYARTYPRPESGIVTVNLSGSFEP